MQSVCLSYFEPVAIAAMVGDTVKVQDKHITVGGVQFNSVLRCRSSIGVVGVASV